MATSATIRRSGSQRSVPVILWPCAAVLLDADGAPLAGVDVLNPVEDGRLPFDAVDELAALLNYCFGQGKHQVMLSFENGIVEGWLETRWEGNHRSWWLELDA
jgi:hypothetical protein